MKYYFKGICTYFRENPGIFVFMILVIFTGVISGSLLVRFLDEEPVAEITKALNHFFDNLNEYENEILAAPELFRISFYRNCALLILIWVLGLFPAGFLMVLSVLFLKGISLGFTIGVLIHRYSVRGALFCLAAILPHNLLLVPAYIVGTAFAFAYSFYLFKNRYDRGKTKLTFFTQYCLYMSLVMVVATLGVLVESFITPVFIRLVLPVL